MATGVRIRKYTSVKAIAVATLAIMAKPLIQLELVTPITRLFPFRLLTLVEEKGS